MRFLRLNLLVAALIFAATLALRAQTVTDEKRRATLSEKGVDPLHGQSVVEEKGNIIYTSPDGARKQLTDSGHDFAPALSLDGKLVAFVRGTPDKIVSTGAGDVEATELWLVGSDGRKPAMLVRGHEAKDVKQVVAGIAGAQFSPDGHRLYFVCAAADSGAVHVFDLGTRKERFFSEGTGFEVVPNGDYQGSLLIQKHKPFIGGGAYDWFWLVRPDGKEEGPVGEDTENFKSTYVK